MILPFFLTVLSKKKQDGGGLPAVCCFQIHIKKETSFFNTNPPVTGVAAGLQLRCWSLIRYRKPYPFLFSFLSVKHSNIPSVTYCLLHIQITNVCTSCCFLSPACFHHTLHIIVMLSKKLCTEAPNVYIIILYKLRGTTHSPPRSL